MKVVVTGAAGLVGQNLIPRLKAQKQFDIVAIDKHRANTQVLRKLHPDISVIEADLAEPGDWTQAFAGAGSAIISHAQIGGLIRDDFVRNNVEATRRVLDAIAQHGGCHVVHISSSVVNSTARDWYVETKDVQEKLAVESGNPCVVLRPTLMFGWFDRKHLGWLARFMKKSPVFPVPGDGRYLRQPLYGGDFCDIILSCIRRKFSGMAYNISGQDKIDYIDLIRLVREACGARSAIVSIPYSVFWAMLRIYALADRDPPFTVSQLEALVTPDVFEVIDWPTIFHVHSTPLKRALEETHRHPMYSSIVLEF